MKTKDLKAMLTKEVDSIMPDVFERVKNSPYYPLSPETEIAEAKKSKFRLKVAMSTCLSLLLIIAIVLPITLLNFGGNADNAQAAFMEIDVCEIVAGTTAATSSNEEIEQPRVAFVVNSGRVSTVRPNDAGLYLLAGENLVGMTVKEATKRVAELNVRLGYIGYGDGVKGLAVSVVGESEELQQSTQKLAKAAATEYFAANKVRAVVVTEDMSKEKLVERAKEYDATANADMSVAALSEIIENGRFYADCVKRALASANAMEEMQRLYEQKTFAILSALTKDFVDTTYDGNRVYAEQRVKALLGAYSNIVQSGNATLGDKNVLTDTITPWDVIDNIETVLAAVNDAYESEREKQAVLAFALSFKEELLAASYEFSNKSAFSGDYVETAFKYTAFDFKLHLQELVLCNGFEAIESYVRNEFLNVMEKFEESAVDATTLSTKTHSDYAAGLEKIVSRSFEVEKENALNNSRSSVFTITYGDWETKEEYSIWVEQVLGGNA